MNNNQKFSPKYWVVHDISTDDVFIDTACKTKSDSENSYITNYLWGKQVNTLSRFDAEDVFENNGNLKCILIEIKEVLL